MYQVVLTEKYNQNIEDEVKTLLQEYRYNYSTLVKGLLLGQYHLVACLERYQSGGFYRNYPPDLRL